VPKTPVIIFIIVSVHIMCNPPSQICASTFPFVRVVEDSDFLIVVAEVCLAFPITVLSVSGNEFNPIFAGGILICNLDSVYGAVSCCKTVTHCIFDFLAEWGIMKALRVGFTIWSNIIMKCFSINFEIFPYNLFTIPIVHRLPTGGKYFKCDFLSVSSFMPSTCIFQQYSAGIYTSPVSVPSACRL